MGQKLVNFSLVDKHGQRIITSGGAVIVCENGSPDQLAVVTTKDGTLATTNNPIAINNGLVRFWCSDTVQSVDLFGFGPGGEAIVEIGLVPSGPNEIVLDTERLFQVAKIPFSHADSTDAVETFTGLDIPTNAILVGIGTAMEVVDTDATETIDIGTAGTSNDPNGFIATGSVATAGIVLGAGALIQTTGYPIASAIGGDEITYTTTAGTDTASGYFLLPYYLYE